MRIQIENCNVIDSGSIDIEPHKLNIKYAINGTGKSTIAKAIQAKVTGNEDGLKQLLPFQYHVHPQQTKQFYIIHFYQVRMKKKRNQIQILQADAS